MKTTRYLQLVVAIIFFFALCPTANAGSHGKRWLVPRLYVKIWKLNKIVANQQETIDELLEEIGELEEKYQNFAPVPQTGQTHSSAPGDDGDLQMGVQWPDPRFTDNGDGTVMDHLTGLIWLKKADCFGELGWRSALSSGNHLADGECGLSDRSVPGDWRLPNVRELFSLVWHRWYSDDALPRGPFTGEQTDRYWSSTGGGVYPPYYDEYAWTVEMRYGHVSLSYPGDDCYVWPVRGGN